MDAATRRSPWVSWLGDAASHDPQRVGPEAAHLSRLAAAYAVPEIEETWASARTEQALAFRQQQGLSTARIGLAVLVQLLVLSDVSGVIVSANPVNNRRDELGIAANWRLGESIVGGTITPDTWIIHTPSRALVAEQIAEKYRMTIAIDGGTREVDVPQILRRQPSLSRSQIDEVARFGQNKGWPVDTGFAYAQGHLCFLQCHSMTTLDGGSQLSADPVLMRREHAQFV